MEHQGAVSNQEYVYITARSLGKNIKESYIEAGYSKKSWYDTSKGHRAALEDMAMQVRRDRSEDARAILDSAGAGFARDLVELSKSEDENIKFKAVKEGLGYILKNEAGTEGDPLSLWKQLMISDESDDDPWGDGGEDTSDSVA